MISKIFNRKLLIFAACIMLASIMFTGIACAATLTVDDSGGADYTRIQDAIDNASAGDTVLVYSGTYYEIVNVNKQLVLRGIDNGTGMPVIDAGVIISANGVTLDSFIVMNAIGAGIYLSDSNNNILTNNNVSNNDNGIHLYSSSNNTLIGNIVNSNEDGIVLTRDSSYNTLIGNTVNSNRVMGINILFSSDNNTLINNTALNNFKGIKLHSSNNNKLSNNVALNNSWGIYMLHSSNNTLSNNNALNNYYGFILLGSSNNTLSKNTALNNYHGIYLDYSIDNTIYNNYFNNTNNFGLGVTIYSNYWSTTKTGGTNIVGGPYLGGNFWAHPNGTGFSQTCTDADREGICDSPYTIDGSNTDYLPLSMNFTVTYDFLGILPPIRTDGSSIFKLGSTVPVKFRITDANGNYVTTATATLTYQLITNEILGTVEEAASTSAANEGNTFRYDSTDNLYIFNLGTEGMNTGTYQLNINLDDGTVHTVRISLR